MKKALLVIGLFMQVSAIANAETQILNLCYKASSTLHPTVKKLCIVEMIDTSISDSDKNLEDPNLYGRMGIELQDKSGRPLATAIEHVSVGKSDFAGFYGVYSETVEKLNKTTFKSNDGTSVIIKYTTAGQVSEAVFLGESVKLAEEDGAK